MVSGKRILLGITGSIAAYKSAILIRLFIKAGAEVKVIMTPSAKDFISPLTLSTLSQNPVITEFSSPQGDWNNHVELGLWADLMIIAPVTANTISKMANGNADNILIATYLSARCPVYIAPAMDLDMYKHPSTQANLNKLHEYGNNIIDARYGFLASGLEGEGRMAEPEEIFSIAENFFNKNKPLKGKKVLITAGPTYENIDPVRFIGNYSSGKMGFALAEKIAELGAQVTLITGPVSLKTVNSQIKRIDVVSAKEMYESVKNNFSNSDITIMAAAVADFTPSEISNQKIKKGEKAPVIQLVSTVDILSELGKLKQVNQILIGFALETNDELNNAKQKLEKKNLDFIILNSLNDKGAGFQQDTNKISIIGKGNTVKNFELKTKTEVADDIIKTCILNFNQPSVFTK